MDHEERLKSALADRYLIEQGVGSGGMATVYLARDLKHDRQVAIKVLDPELARTVGAERFLREIKTAANLSHPHILPVFDSGESDGFLYYSMPYVRGESLRDRLTREKQLPVEDALQITREIADALAYAHREGVIHRDVKPENILLEGGHAVLADFGVAQAVAEAKEERITRTGTSVGTPAYMSPEQAMGEANLDGRSDQYALGCVLYEMLSGDAPYLASTPQAVIAKKLGDPLPKVSVVRETVPDTVEEALRKALARNPVDRFTTAGDFAAALGQGGTPVKARSRWGRTKAVVYIATVVLGLATVAVIATVWPTGRSDSLEHIVAVIPFDNRTGDPSLDGYGSWAAGFITDELFDAQLTQVRTLQDVMAVAEGESEGAASGSLSQDWAQKTGASLAVRGAFYRVPGADSIEFSLEVVDPERTLRGRLSTIRAATEDPTEAFGTLAVQVVRTLAEIVAPGHELEFSASGRHPPKQEAQEALLEGWRLIGIGAGSEAAIPHLKRAIELDSLYIKPLYVLKVAYNNLLRPVEGDSICQILGPRIDEMNRLERLEVEWQCPDTRVGDRTTVEIVREMVRIRPGYNYVFGLVLNNANRPREAAEAFAIFDTAWAPEGSTIAPEWKDANLSAWARSLHMLEEYSKELGHVREARLRFPHHNGLIYAEIRALIALGRHDEARRMVGDQLASLAPGQDPYSLLDGAAQESGAHGRPEVAEELWGQALAWYENRPADVLETAGNRKSRATLLLYLDRLAEAEALLEPLVSQFPDTVETYGELGILRSKQGERDAAERISAGLAAWDWPRKYALTWWRASIAAHLGDRDEAVRLLEQAMEEGWAVQDKPHRLPFLKPLRGYPAFEELVKPKG